ncbi:N4-gp56 family major capsid protein [Cupriavidus sp. UYPR2.512]|uniref:N4-gp56 family major capsid protein n=1 Tax=Cupriavidus sp. UYPR2.512 TaxID=1080187 RepID=UPI000366476D|nr:N4-gp56 family major capsid protein [Cupriavidus sp. UYPR2.512]UIF90860.1 N4-gp56 family major capsid protein [Cupriavidus necator]
MAQTAYGDISPRTAAYASKDLLKRGIPFLVIEKFGQAKPLPANHSKTIVFRRYNALPTTPVALTEGVTPAGQTLNSTDVSLTLSQYGDKTTITDIVQDTHEDPVLAEATELLGEQAAQIVEKVRFGVLKAGTNVQYANGASRAAVNTPISLTLQRRATRALKRQNGRPITKIVRSTPSFGTENVAPAYIALVHPDLESDIRGLAGFTPAEKYGSITPYENELGKVEDVRYVTSTIFEPWLSAGGAPGTMLSGNTTNADVYPVLFLAANAYGIVALKGAFAITPMVVNAKPSDSDPLAQRGHVAWKTMQGAILLQDLWLCRGEVACTA